MNELDFDELDKAVNSLMSGMDTTKRNTALDDPEDNVVSLAPGTADNAATPATPTSSPQTDPGVAAAPVVAAPAPAIEEKAPASAQPLAMKRRGQFMDMVHPSSDMKTVTSAPKREGVSIQPSSPFVPPALSQLGASDSTPGTELKPEPQPPVVDVVAPQQVNETPATEATEPEEKKNDWPDPIDMAMSPVEDTSTATDTTVPAEPADLPTDVVNEVATPNTEEPLSSPFLPDAKVEKRPLGGAVTDMPVGAADVVAAADPVPIQETSSSDVSPVQLPEELKTDVMALESTSTSGTTEAQPSPVEIAPADTPKKEESAQPEPEKKDIPQTGSGSIPQQYTEQPSTGNKSNTPIYDTSTHQPLSTPAKKASPLKWIILMLVLLILGAIGGAVYFYFSQHMG